MELLCNPYKMAENKWPYVWRKATGCLGQDQTNPSRRQGLCVYVSFVSSSPLFSTCRSISQKWIRTWAQKLHWNTGETTDMAELTPTELQLGWWFQIFFIWGNDPIWLAYVSDEPQKKKTPTFHYTGWIIGIITYNVFLIPVLTG